jgi:hypothetical protein
MKKAWFMSVVLCLVVSTVAVGAPRAKASKIITAKQLAREFDANPNKACDKYRNQDVTVAGTADYIT